MAEVWLINTRDRTATGRTPRCSAPRGLRRQRRQVDSCCCDSLLFAFWDIHFPFRSSPDLIPVLVLSETALYTSIADFSFECSLDMALPKRIIKETERLMAEP